VLKLKGQIDQSIVLRALIMDRWILNNLAQMVTSMRQCHTIRHIWLTYRSKVKIGLNYISLGNTQNIHFAKSIILPFKL